MFAFGSVAISDPEAFEIIQKARTENPVGQMLELKASETPRDGTRKKKLIGALLTAIDGRYVVSVNDGAAGAVRMVLRIYL